MMLGVLGPLRLVVQEHDVEVTAPKQRTLLALLAMRRNTFVRIPRISNELWPQEPPESAADNVRTYVSAVRRSLAGERERLVTQLGAYMLHLSDVDFDVAAFRREAEAARVAQAAGLLAEALHGFAAALQWCRGEPLQDVPAGAELTGYAKSLTESVLGVREDFLVAQFHHGECNGALAGLRRLAADAPSRESTWHALIRLLYENGDRTGALDAFREARQALADTLGLDPGPQLQQLHQDMLRGRAVAAKAGGASTITPVPRQLPPHPQLVVARQEQLALIESAITPGGAATADPPQRPRVVVIHGIGGVGKSTLALSAAHRAGAEFPDGQLYLDLRGSAPGLTPMSPPEALGRLLRAIGVPEKRISPDPDEAEGMFRSVTAGRRLLLLLDNAIDPAQVRPLLPAATGSAVVITSRRPCDTLDGAVQIRLGPLSPDDAVTMLSSLAGADRVGRDRQAAAEVVRLTGCLPLALRIAGLRVTRHGESDLARMAARLRQERSTLDELGFADLDVRASFEVGYRGVTSDPAFGEQAARIFRLLGPLQLNRFSCGDAAAAAGIGEEATLHALELLIDHGLIERVGTGYLLHDLLRLYALELFGRHDGIEAQRQAAVQIANRYVAIITHSPALCVPGVGGPPAAASPEHPDSPQDMAAAERWLEEHGGYIGVLSRMLYADASTRESAWELLRPLARRLMTSYPSLCIELYRPLVDDFDDTDWQRQRIWALCAVASAHAYLVRKEETLRYAGRALDLVDKYDDEPLRAQVLAHYGTDLHHAGRPVEALEYLSEAIILLQALGNQLAVATLLNTSASVLHMLGRPRESLALLRRSLAIRRQHPDVPSPRGSIMSGLATVHLRLGHPRLAECYADAALEWSESGRSTAFHVDSLILRSLARERLGDVNGALADAQTATVLAQESGSAGLHLMALRNLAAIQWLSGAKEARQTLADADLLAASTSD